MTRAEAAPERDGGNLAERIDDFAVTNCADDAGVQEDIMTVGPESDP